MSIGGLIYVFGLLLLAAGEGQTVDAVLDRLEQAGVGLRDLSANVTYTVTQLIKQNPDDPDEVQNYHGSLQYLVKGDQKLAKIHFEWSDDGRLKDPSQMWVIFDGRWVIEAKEKTKTVIKREVVRPSEASNPFKLGEGPFPLPFGQKKAEILEQFEVTLRAAGPDDPPQADRLLCTPRPNTELARQYEWIELFVSRAKGDSLGVPVKIVAHDRREAVLKTAVFKKLRRNWGLKPGSFKLPPQTDPWQRFIEPLPD